MKNKIKKIVISKNDGTTECYVSFRDYKKMKQSYEDKLKNHGQKKKLKVGDTYRFSDMDWYVIGVNEEKQRVKLMLKNTIESMAYSNNNSNDYCESNVKKYLEEDFIKKLDKEKLLEMKINYDEDKHYNGYVRIPTLREIETLPMDIRDCGDYYWTMTSSYGVSEDCTKANVFRVSSSGLLASSIVNVASVGLRPVITLNTEAL